MQGNAYYIVAEGDYADHTLAHINETIAEQRLKNVVVKDLRDKVALISVQGPNRLVRFNF